jgi:hypothetical protein
MMTREDAAAMEEFLILLQHSDLGRTIAVDIWDALRSRTINTATVTQFLLDCAKTCTRDGSTPLVAVNSVRLVSLGQGHGRREYLRQCKQPHFDVSSKEMLSNTIATKNFNRYVLSKEYKAKARLPTTLPLNPASTARRVKAYTSRLQRVTAHPDWKQPAAVMGLPLTQPSNCWFTTDRFPEDPGSPSYPPHEAGTKVRDELGLHHYRARTVLLRYTFPASDLAALTHLVIARPMFADAGNTRFRSGQNSTRAAHFAQEGWGATVHLKKLLMNAGDPDTTGVSERVSHAIPLSDVRNLRVSYIGDVTEDRGRTPGIDDDRAFADRAESVYADAAKAAGVAKVSDWIRDRILAKLTGLARGDGFNGVD